MYHDFDDINEKYKQIDIYAKDSICPICKKAMIQTKTKSMFASDCENTCYSIIRYDSVNSKTITIFIFNSEIIEIEDRDYIEGSNLFKEIEIAKEISYWIENDRYIAKILTL